MEIGRLLITIDTCEYMRTEHLMSQPLGRQIAIGLFNKDKAGYSFILIPTLTPANSIQVPAIAVVRC